MATRLALPPRESLGAMVRRALAFDAAAVYPTGALRAAAVLCAVLAVAIGASGSAVAATAGVGALMAGVVSVSRTNRRPLQTMAATTVGISAAVFVGSAASHPPWLHLVVLAAWAFSGGLFIAFGDGGGAVGIQATVAFIVLGRYPQPVAGAAKLAGFAAAGGAAQLLVAALSRWSSALARQRQAITAAYQRLAEVATVGPPTAAAAEALDQAALTLSSPSLFRRPDLMPLRSLVEEGRRIRIQLAGLTGLREQAARAGRSSAETTRALEAAAAVLGGVAAAVGRQPVDLSRLRETVRAIDDIAGSSEAGGAAAHLHGLAGQLRAVLTLAEQVQESRARVALVAGEKIAVGNLPARVRAQAALLAANLSRHSNAGRHAVRLSAVVVLAEIIGNHIPLQRGYWVAVTATIVLRPDFSATWTRGVARLGGTLVGAAVIGILAEATHPTGGWAVLAIGVIAFGAFMTFPASYAVFTAFMTGLVVLLVSLATPGTLTTTGDRLADTVIGGALALAAYVVWPSWSAPDARYALAELLEAEQRYVASVLGVVLGTGVGPGRESWPGLSRDLRLRRTNAEAAVDRALSEPHSGGLTRPMAAGVLDGLRRTSLAAHALRTGEHLPGRGDGAATVFVAAVSQSLADAAGAMRTGTPISRAADLRVAERRLAGVIPSGLVAQECDEIVDAVDTVMDALRTASEV